MFFLRNVFSVRQLRSSFAGSLKFSASGYAKCSIITVRGLGFCGRGGRSKEMQIGGKNRCQLN
ncbi:hypothetical protein SBA5_410043 [Candidatus Sulfotelmatomonas gaucii]|uniref:Uncharacterized protein n=1 Tax=Candidatus Sulfuritelmatomonas gaucii TaxID=2043161 RepID=A0A2N9LL74_9BACT|nr:hypothetical protein SBA5_410043 [Candidatus Sulfotelmatomonas gaucii]